MTMSEQQLIAHYSTFTFEDFLQDDYFIASVNNPTEETVSFWLLFEESNKNREEYLQSKAALEAMGKPTYTIDRKKTETLWNKIEESNRENSLRRKRKKLTYTISAIAASVIILIVALPFVYSPDVGSDEIVKFAEMNSNIDFSKDHIQLVISDKKTVELDAKESTIRIDSTDIRIDQQDVSKTESAEYNQLIVPRGKRSKLTLADGSLLHVNSGTRVIYPINFASKYREIYVDGEVLIDVTKDASKPFIVKTRDVSVEVLGTTFNVMAYANESSTQIALQSGSIKILDSEKSNASSILKPREMFEIKNQKRSIRIVDIDKHLSWTKGIYHYKSERLEDILLKLGRYYGVDVECDEKVANYICSGKIDIDHSIEEVLDGLSYVLPVKISKSDKRYIIS